MSDMQSNKRKTQTKPNLPTAFPKNVEIDKNKKKSKHGKKNWRKNIDISDLEKKNIQKDKEELLEKQIGFLKDNELFTIDLKPNQKVDKSFLNKKTERKDKKKQISKVEERTIKRIAENYEKNKNSQNDKIKKEIGIWDFEDNNQNKISFRKIHTPEMIFPKVPLPHPGQSYNPSKQDLSTLLYKVVEVNRKPHLEVPVVEPLEQKQFESDVDSEHEDEIVEYKANNPAVDDFTQRKTKTEKNIAIKKKLNRIKEIDLIKKKDNKVKLANEKSLKRVEKEREATIKDLDEKRKETLKIKNEKEELLKMGITDDADHLNDFQVKKESVPLRKIKNKGNFLSERFENILKRNVVGEFTHKMDKKRNRKLAKFSFKDLDNTDYGFDLGDGAEKLKIFE